MRILTAIAAAAGLLVAASTSVLACSWEKQVTAQSEMPAAQEQQSAASTPVEAAPQREVASEPATTPAATTADAKSVGSIDLAQSQSAAIKAN